MYRIRRIYQTFLPFLLLFLGMLLLIFIMDSYAERISRKPEIIVLSQQGDENYTDPLTWKISGMEGNDEIESDSTYISAVEAFNKKDFTTASEGFTLLSRRYPLSPVPANYLGMIEVRMGSYPAAIKFFIAAVDLDSTNSNALCNLASVYKKVKRLRESEYYYRKALVGKPTDPDIYMNLGMLYFEQEDWSKARQSFIASRDLSSGKKKSRALIQKGLVELLSLDTVTAREDLNQAILLEPESEEARTLLFKTLVDPVRQKEELLKIYRLNNRSFSANFYLGEIFEQEGELQRAEHHYKKALEQDPSNAEIINHLSSLLMDQQRMEEVELVIKGFIPGDTLPQAYFLKARMADKMGNKESAENLYQLAVRKAGNNYPEASVNLAILQKEKSNYKAAIRNYKDAISARPYYSTAYYNLALIYAETDSVDKAIESYKNAIYYDSTSFKSWYNLARLYDKQGDTDKEILALRSAVRIKPDYTRALIELGNAYLNRENLQAAVETYLTLVDIYPKYNKAWFNLGIAYNRIGNNELAIKAYERLLELNPDHVGGRINLAILYSRTGQVKLAVSTLEEAVNIDMANADVRYNLALQYEKLGMDKKAIYQFLKVVELDPRREIAYDQLLDIYNRKADTSNFEVILFKKNKALGIDVDFYETGKRLHELEQYPYAIESYQYALQMGNDNSWITYWIGKAYMDMKKIRTGIPYFEAVLKPDPEHRFSLYRLGQSYEMLGRKDQAERYYNKLKRIDPDFKIVRKAPIDGE